MFQIERERCFLLKGRPDVEPIGEMIIRQLYLAIGYEQIRVREIIRETGSEFYLTIKRGFGIDRLEFETSITKETFDQLSLMSSAPFLTRHCVVYPLPNGLEAYVSTYEQEPYAGLQTIEVEFDSEEAALSFEPLSWFGDEVTDRKEYENQYIWRVVAHKSTESSIP